MRAQGPQHSRFQAIAIENVQDKTERKRKSKESKFLTKENFRQSRPQKKEPEEREGLAMGELKCRSVHHHGIRAELSQRTFDFSTHDHHNQASRILTEVLSTGFK